MARKLEPANAKAEPQSDAARALEDLYVMQPDVELEIDGRKLTIGEYRLFDGMTARAKAAPLIDDLEALVKDGSAADAGIEAYLDLLAKHRTLTRELILLAVVEEDRDADLINSIKGPNAERLLLTWWGTCSRFFWRAVVGRQRDRVMAGLRRKTDQAGPTSSPPAPASAAANSAASATSTPSVN